MRIAMLVVVMVKEIVSVVVIKGELDVYAVFAAAVIKGVLDMCEL